MVVGVIEKVQINTSNNYDAVILIVLHMVKMRWDWPSHLSSTF